MRVAPPFARVGCLLLSIACCGPARANNETIAYTTFDRSPGAGLLASSSTVFAGQYASRFVPDETGVIRRVSWWGRNSLSVVPVLDEHTRDFGVAIYSDVGGAPSPVAVYTATINTTVTPSAVVRTGRPVLRYDLVVPATYEITAGDTLWMSVFDVTGGRTRFEWSNVFGASPSPPNVTSAYFRALGASNWGASGFSRLEDFHFEVAVVPEPATASMIAVIATLAATRTRRRRN